MHRINIPIMIISKHLDPIPNVLITLKTFPFCFIDANLKLANNIRHILKSNKTETAITLQNNNGETMLPWFRCESFI